MNLFGWKWDKLYAVGVNQPCFHYPFRFDSVRNGFGVKKIIKNLLVEQSGVLAGQNGH